MFLCTATTATGGLRDLVAQALHHLESLGYSPGSIANYRRAWREFLQFTEEESKGDAPFTALVERFLQSRGVHEGKIALMCRQRFFRTAMRVLTEFSLHGCVQPCGRITERVTLSPAMATTLAGYKQFHQDHVHRRPATVRTREKDILRFLHYLESRGVSISEIQPSTVSAFALSLATLKPMTLARVMSSLRSFFRYLCTRGLVPGDLAEQVPTVRVRRDARIPSVWKSGDVEALVNVVDRSSPCGKRDYAILLLAARLGMRVGDIRTLRLEHLLWDQARIEIQQGKTGTPLSLPLTEEIGHAIIAYLRHGRPPTHYREVFLRANAPFQPFSCNNNLHHIITAYRRRAGIVLPKLSRRGMHSLRHTVASRLFESGTPLETISDLMGHLSTETTRLYTKVDVAALRSVAIDPEELTHA